MQNCILLLQALVSNVFRYARFISKLAHGVHKVPISPKFSTPKLLLHLWMLLEDLSCCQTFHCRYDLRRALRWNTLYQEMNMVFVNSNFQKENVVPCDILQDIQNDTTTLKNYATCECTRFGSIRL